MMVLFVILLILLAVYITLTMFGVYLRKKGQYPFIEKDLQLKGGKYLKTKDGRRIEYFIYGRLEDYDYVVVNMHGSGLEAKYERNFYEPVCEELKVKGISISMPGCGYSDIQPGRVVCDWPKDDLKLVLEAENVDKFMITGHSQGTIHAMAAAKYFEKRCIGVGLFAPFIPKVQLGNKSDKYVIGDGAVPYTKTINKTYGAIFFTMIHLTLLTFCKQTGKVAVKKIGKNIELESLLAKRFRNSMKESVVRGSVGASYESTQDVAFEFGFDLFSINNPNIVIWHAKDDSECPVEHSLLLKEAFEKNSGEKVKFKSDSEGFGHLTYAQDKYRIADQSLIHELIVNIKKSL